MAVPFTAVLPTLLGETRFEPRPQRIRVSRAGEPVADTTSAYLVWEPRRIVPLYAVPHADFLVPLVPADRVDPDLDTLPRVMPPGRFDSHSTSGDTFDLVVAGEKLHGAAFRPDEPELGGRVILDFAPFTWLEEDETLVGHPHDPFKRIDVLASGRHVQVLLDGVTLADSTRPMMLLETGLPVRWYLPRSDVRLDLLTRTDTRTTCAYKGHASYWSYEPAGPEGRNLAWTYEDPLHDALRVKDLVCFFAERTDTVVDGVLQERPDTYWRRPVQTQ